VSDCETERAAFVCPVARFGRRFTADSHRASLRSEAARSSAVAATLLLSPDDALIVTFRAEIPHAVPGATLLSTGTAEVRLPADRARVTISVQSGNDSSSVTKQIVEALVSAGIERSSVEVRQCVVQADVHAPDAAAADRIRSAITGVSSRTNQQLNRNAVYAVDDCDTGDKAALAAAVANARAAAVAAARERNVKLGRIVAAADVGARPEEFCGPDVLAKASFSPLGQLGPPVTLIEPVVIARANVQLVYGMMVELLRVWASSTESRASPDAGFRLRRVAGASFAPYDANWAFSSGLLLQYLWLR